ncbi:hypothetical protein IWX90DRAFT_419669 [Phyllosticta citrichinensis]|uniref:Secreted protein n=1 Tax=Phyllosticta citrichinensis TaxID=1130410 RepID=A0ABR1Y4X7_9PEZI
MLILVVLQCWGLALGRLDIGSAIRSFFDRRRNFLWMGGAVYLAVRRLTADHARRNSEELHGRASDLIRVPQGIDDTPSQPVHFDLAARFPTTRPTLAFSSAALTCSKSLNAHNKQPLPLFLRSMASRLVQHLFLSCRARDSFLPV